MATDSHSEYVIIIAFPLQLCLRERALTLRLYVHCVSFYLVATLAVVLARVVERRAD